MSTAANLQVLWKTSWAISSLRRRTLFDAVSISSSYLNRWLWIVARLLASHSLVALNLPHWFPSIVPPRNIIDLPHSSIHSQNPPTCVEHTMAAVASITKQNCVSDRPSEGYDRNSSAILFIRLRTQIWTRIYCNLHTSRGDPVVRSGVNDSLLSPDSLVVSSGSYFRGLIFDFRPIGWLFWDFLFSKSPKVKARAVH